MRYTHLNGYSFPHTRFALARMFNLFHATVPGSDVYLDRWASNLLCTLHRNHTRAVTLRLS